MRIWICSLALIAAACGGASTAGLFDSDGGSEAASSTNGSMADAGASPVDGSSTPRPPPTGEGGTVAPSSTPDAGNSPLPKASDDCPQTADYAYEFSNVAIEAPLCGPSHGGACADPSKDCCYFDSVSNAHVCMAWLDGGQ